MQLVTASEDDKNPIIQVWNLRNTQMPVSTLEGHTQGVWSTSWCPHDSKFLLSTGKENRAICWNVETGTIAQDISLRSEWNSSIQWSLKSPALFTVSSYQEQVGIYTIHDVQGSKKQTSSGETVYDLSTPPTWLSRPAGASFAFGGKLISVERSKIQIKSVTSHPDLIESAQKLEEIINSDDQQQYCRTRANDASSDEEKQVWDFFSALLEPNKRNAILNRIGFNKEDVRKAVKQLTLDNNNNNEAEQQQQKEEQNDETITLEGKDEQEENQDSTEQKHEKDVSDLFGNNDDDFNDNDDPFSGFDSHGNDDPFNSFDPSNQDDVDPWDALDSETQSSFDNNQQQQNSDQNNQQSHSISIIDLARNTKTPLNFLHGISNNEQILIRNIMLKNFDDAIECCFKLNRPADALMIALVSEDSDLLESTKSRYFRDLPKESALHFVDRLSHGKLREIVAQSNIDEWKCTLAIICSYSSTDEEFYSLCSDLGDLLAHCGQAHAANLCYICANNMDKAVALWDAQCNDNNNNNNAFDNLQNIMERICVFRNIVQPDQIPSVTVKKYCQYAELLASQGELEHAQSLISFMKEGDYSEHQYGSLLLDRITSAISDSDSPISYPSGAFDQPQPTQTKEIPTQIPSAYLNNNNNNNNNNPIQTNPLQQQQQNPNPQFTQTPNYNPSGNNTRVQVPTYQAGNIARPNDVTPQMKPMNPAFNPVTPINPIRPVVPVNPMNPVSVNPVKPITTFNPNANPTKPPAPVSGIFNPYATPKTDLQIPQQEELPASVTGNRMVNRPNPIVTPPLPVIAPIGNPIKPISTPAAAPAPAPKPAAPAKPPGKVEIADKLSAVRKQFLSNPNLVCTSFSFSFF